VVAASRSWVIPTVWAHCAWRRMSGALRGTRWRWQGYANTRGTDAKRQFVHSSCLERQRASRLNAWRSRLNALKRIRHRCVRRCSTESWFGLVASTKPSRRRNYTACGIICSRVPTRRLESDPPAPQDHSGALRRVSEASQALMAPMY